MPIAGGVPAPVTTRPVAQDAAGVVAGRAADRVHGVELRVSVLETPMKQTAFHRVVAGTALITPCASTHSPLTRTTQVPVRALPFQPSGRNPMSVPEMIAGGVAARLRRNQNASQHQRRHRQHDDREPTNHSTPPDTRGLGRPRRPVGLSSERARLP